MLPVHLVAGGLAIVLGAVALLSAKGRVLHRRSGKVFVVAMLTMGITGSILALRQSLTNPNALGGLMSVYFVITAWLTVQPASSAKRWASTVALIGGCAVALAWFRLGIRGVVTHPPNVDPMSIYSTFVFGGAMSLGVVGDWHVMRVQLVGAPRLRRHLWRMCIGLLIALASFFTVPERVAKILPQPFTTPVMRALPVLLVMGAMCYWLWKLRRRGMSAAFERVA